MGTIENLEKQTPKESEVVCDLMTMVAIIMLLLRFSSDAFHVSAWAPTACLYDPTLHDSAYLLLEHVLWAITEHLKIAQSLLYCDHYINLNILRT